MEVWGVWWSGAEEGRERCESVRGATGEGVGVGDGMHGLILAKCVLPKAYCLLQAVCCFLHVCSMQVYGVRPE